MGQKPSHLADSPLSRSDLAIASIAAGFTCGFGFLTIWEAVKQTLESKNPKRSIYIWLVWLEIVSCVGFGVISILMLVSAVQIRLWTLIGIIFFWCFKIQFMLQIIINRVLVIMPDQRKGNIMKWTVAGIFVIVNISVYVIWIPARMGVSHEWVVLNEIWDRVEKVIYLITDAILNWYFIRTVRNRLIAQGSSKYNKLVEFNVRIIVLSIAMDFLVIGLMNLQNSLVYLQFHPLAFMVKLNIEMSMARLIKKIAAEKTRVDNGIHAGLSTSNDTYHMTVSAGPNKDRESRNIQAGQHMGPGVMVHKQVIVESKPMEEDTDNEGSVKSSGDLENNGDEAPLRQGQWNHGEHRTVTFHDGK